MATKVQTHDPKKTGRIETDANGDKHYPPYVKSFLPATIHARVAKVAASEKIKIEEVCRTAVVAGLASIPKTLKHDEGRDGKGTRVNIRMSEAELTRVKKSAKERGWLPADVALTILARRFGKGS